MAIENSGNDKNGRNTIAIHIDEQKFLSEHFQKISSIWQYYQLDTQRIEMFKTELDNFSIRLPLVGSFSAGKSSLINFLLKDRLLGTNINPETNIPAEIHYSDEEIITLNEPERSSIVIDRSNLKKNDFSDIPDNSWLDIGVPLPVLHQISTVILVDMPGWASGIDRHSMAIDHYLGRSSAYCLVVSVDEGGLKQNLKLIIEELALNNKPMMLVITKADKKPTEEVSRVAKHVQQEIEKITKQKLLSLSITGRNDTAEFELALQEIAPLNAAFFHQRVGILAQQLLNDLKHHLTLLLNSNNMTLDEIKEQREQIVQQKKKLSEEIEQSEYQLRNELSRVENYIQQEFESRVKNQLEILTSAVQNGGDISGPIGTSLRMAYTSGVEDKLKPLIKNKLRHIEKISSESFSEFNISYHFTKNNEQENLPTGIFNDIAPFLIGLLTKIPLLAPITIILKSAFRLFSDKVNQELAYEKQRENARKYVINSLIPDCQKTVSVYIYDALLRNVDDIIDKLNEQVKQQLDIYQYSLSQLEQKMLSEQLTDKENKNRITIDLNTIAGLSTYLKDYDYV